jgi:hypothetical protein
MLKIPKFRDGRGGGCPASSGAELCRSRAPPAHQHTTVLAWLLYLNYNCCSQFAYHHVITQITVSHFGSNIFCFIMKNITPPAPPLTRAKGGGGGGKKCGSRAVVFYRATLSNIILNILFSLRPNCKFCVFIISGILQRDQENSVIYGSIDSGKTVASNSEFLKLVCMLGLFYTSNFASNAIKTIDNEMINLIKLHYLLFELHDFYATEIRRIKQT